MGVKFDESRPAYQHYINPCWPQSMQDEVYAKWDAWQKGLHPEKLSNTERISNANTSFPPASAPTNLPSIQTLHQNKGNE